jgi:predicted Zn-dependent protease
MRDFFRKMAAEEKISLGWFSSHPASSERFERMDAALAQLPPAARTVPPLAYDYAAVKAALPAAREATKDTKDKP